MKKSLFFVLLTLCSLLFVPYSIGQGNLQFNQVISENFSISGGVNNTLYDASNSYTVPVGKVWKIESVSFSSLSVNSTYSPSVFLKINGSNVLFNYGSQKNIGDYGGSLTTQPIWLKEGDIIGFSMRNRCTTSCLQSVDGHVSIVEFNVIP